MEYVSFEQAQLICALLDQIRTAITQLQQWNEEVGDMHQLVHSEFGMQRVAGNCMLIQAIGEGVRKIDKHTNGLLLQQYPNIPWQQVMSMRNRISHGYFDLDIDYITDIINNDLQPLLETIVSMQNDARQGIIDTQSDEL